MLPNDPANASPTQGVAGGYLFSAPRTDELVSAIPYLASIHEPLPDAFVNLGYVSSDGVTESESASTRTDTDVEGRPVGTTRFDRTETVRFKLVETRSSALAERHGQTNADVAGHLATLHHNNAQREHRIYVAELVLKDGRRWRKIIPDGQVIEVGELVLSSSSVAARELTVGCCAHAWQFGGESFCDTVVDFLELADTDGPAGEAQGTGTVALASLLTSLALSPAFDPEVTNYSTATTASMIVTRAVPADPAATMSCSLAGTTYGLASGADRSHQLRSGPNRLQIGVANAGTGEERTYTIDVTKRAPAAGDPTLSSLTFLDEPLWPIFSREKARYSTTSRHDFTVMYAEPTSGESTVSYRLNGGEWTHVPGKAYRRLDLSEGANALEITVTNGGSSSSYEVSIIRKP